MGCAFDLFERLMDHMTDHCSNVHLQNAINKYGLSNFVFAVVENIPLSQNSEENRALLLSREQYYLDWLFSLSAEYRYNFLSTAGTSLGYRHTEETLAKISVAQKGANNPNQAKLCST